MAVTHSGVELALPADRASLALGPAAEAQRSPHRRTDQPLRRIVHRNGAGRHVVSVHTTTLVLALILPLALAVLAVPLAAPAQQPPGTTARIGFLGDVPSFLEEAFRQGLRELGYVEGQNIAIEHRAAEWHYERLPGLAAELVRLKVDVIVAASPPATQAAKQATTTIPIVFTVSGDPVAEGFVASLARPGGNLTGLATISPELVGKRYHELAAELVALKPDVIVAAFTPSVSAAKRATSTIPIVMAIAGDPVGTGLVASLARPGASITGMSLQNSPEIAGKRLGLLKEAFPRVSQIGLLVNKTLPHRDFIWRDLQSTALAIGLQLQPFEVRGPEDFVGGLLPKASVTFQAMIVHPDPLAFSHRREIAEFGINRKMPVMAAYGFAEAGCLMSFDAYWPDLFQRAASYVDKILKGAKPAELPIEQPTKFALVINLRTARTLGLTLPPALLLRADHVIQ